MKKAPSSLFAMSFLLKLCLETADATIERALQSVTIRKTKDREKGEGEAVDF